MHAFIVFGMSSNVSIRRLRPGDIATLRALNAMFAAAFEDAEHYAAAPPDDAYLGAQLAKPQVVALVAEARGSVIGGLVAYVLDKLEQARSEIYIYDLAVAEACRRQGVASALIAALRPVAREAGARVIYVQADPVDQPAVALYTKLGRRQDALHIDIDVEPREPIG
jgi:aminoglycoside 3-N-acetyltransferase I